MTKLFHFLLKYRRLLLWISLLAFLSLELWRILDMEFIRQMGYESLWPSWSTKESAEQGALMKVYRISEINAPDSLKPFLSFPQVFMEKRGLYDMKRGIQSYSDDDSVLVFVKPNIDTRTHNNHSSSCYDDNLGPLSFYENNGFCKDQYNSPVFVIPLRHGPSPTDRITVKFGANNIELAAEETITNDMIFEPAKHPAVSHRPKYWFKTVDTVKKIFAYVFLGIFVTSLTLCIWNGAKK